MPLGWALVGWGLAILFTLLFFLARRRQHRLREKLQARHVRLAEMEARITALIPLEDSLARETDLRTGLEQERSALLARLEERERAMEEQRLRMETDFRSIAARMLGETHETFLKRANETFEKHQAAAMSAAEKKHEAVNELLRPVRETLTRYEKGLAEMRDQNKRAQGELTSRIADLTRSAGDVQAEAAKLATALKSGPGTRGKWGEESLRNVVEMTGMSAYVDFEEQMHLADEGGAKKPDMVVRLPAERVIAVDSKVSLNAYLEAAEAPDEASRQILLAKHAEQIRAHMRGLAAKDYAASLRKQGSLDFVVMFIPGDNFFAAAMEARPDLFQEAFDKGVLMATPTTLIAILKSIAYGWRQERAAESAHHVAEMAKDLYTSLCRMGDGLTALGKSLHQSVQKYNSTIGTIEGTVMPKARRFAEYEMPGTEKPVSLLEPLETDVREPRRDRDLLIGEDDAA